MLNKYLQFLSGISKDLLEECILNINVKKIEISSIDYNFIKYIKSNKIISQSIAKFIQANIKINNYSNVTTNIDKILNIIRCEFIKTNYNFKIISTKFYKYLDYSLYLKNDTGNLSGDCMSRPHCHAQNFFKIFDNSNIKCLVIYNDTKTSVAGFCILFYGETNKYYDKVYSVNSDLTNYIHEFLQEKGYTYAYDGFSNPHTDGLKILEGIKLTKWNFKKYPYIDSFRIIDVKTGILYHKNYLHHIYDEDKILFEWNLEDLTLKPNFKSLDNTEGGFEKIYIN